MPEFIEFVERGVTFEIQESDGRDDYLLAIRVDGDIRQATSCPSWHDVGAAVDACLAKMPTDPLGDGFRGFEIERWDHETRMMGTLSIPTRGRLLEWFEDGTSPTVEEVVDLAECAGDVVMLVKDGRGNVLLDRREEAEAAIARMIGPSF